jgi:hypothetical protein
LVNFNKDVSFAVVLRALEEGDLRPATISELLTLGVKYPDRQRNFLIFAFGSSRHLEHRATRPGGMQVGCLASVLGERHVCLLPRQNIEYTDKCRFAAVRK